MEGCFTGKDSSRKLRREERGDEGWTAGLASLDSMVTEFEGDSGVVDGQGRHWCCSSIRIIREQLTNVKQLNILKKFHCAVLSVYDIYIISN